MTVVIVSNLEGYEIQAIHGFVEELFVSPDPEYRWVEQFRNARASNDERQQLFMKLSRSDLDH